MYQTMTVEADKVTETIKRLENVRECFVIADALDASVVTLVLILKA